MAFYNERGLNLEHVTFQLGHLDGGIFGAFQYRVNIYLAHFYDTVYSRIHLSEVYVHPLIYVNPHPSLFYLHDLITANSRFSRFHDLRLLYCRLACSPRQLNGDIITDSQNSDCLHNIKISEGEGRALSMRRNKIRSKYNTPHNTLN